MALIDVIKMAAAQTNEPNVPAAFLFGTVTGVSPLTVRVDGRFDITGEALVVTREFLSGGSLMHTHTIDPHGHVVPAHSTQTASNHSHDVPALNTEATGLTANRWNGAPLMSTRATRRY